MAAPKAKKVLTEEEKEARKLLLAQKKAFVSAAVGDNPISCDDALGE